MQQSGNRWWNTQGKVALLCVLLSLSVHVAGAWLILQLPEPQKTGEGKKASTATTRALKIKRSRKKEKKTKKAEQQEAPAPKPFAKTDADRPEVRPEQADFQGKRNSQAEGVSDGPQRSDDYPVPTMAGEEKEEINTVERERQDGPIEHEGKNQPTSAPPPTPDPAPGVPDAPPVPNPDAGQQISDAATPEATPSTRPQSEQKDGDMKRQPVEEEKPVEENQQQSTHPPGQMDATGKAPIPTRPKIRRPIYDPSLADHAQPGFRTTERRSRSTGRFILGRNPALNVAATPMGRYEELIYRLVARRWYIACDEHRGDIIPGRIIIAFRLNKRGGVETMNLITRRGASVIQQSFTFGAIRQAQLPPMPPAVQKELIGEQLELIFTFNFD